MKNKNNDNDDDDDDKYNDDNGSDLWANHMKNLSARYDKFVYIFISVKIYVIIEVDLRWITKIKREKWIQNYWLWQVFCEEITAWTYVWKSLKSLLNEWVLVMSWSCDWSLKWEEDVMLILRSMQPSRLLNNKKDLLYMLWLSY